MNMKNRLAYLFLGIFGLVGLASCESQLEDVPGVKTRTVFFSSVEKDAATRTGITIENKVVTPDWRKTKAANVHLFETGNDGGVSTGEDVEITVASDNLTASFKADFPAEWTIIVDPTEPTEEGAKGGGTKSVSNAPYTYSAVVAQKSGESFIVPSVQYPDAETLIDPDADFLIGYSKKSYGDPHDYTENVVDLYFDRPVALSRITVTNFEEGEKVKSVTIKAQSGLTGSAAYNAIDFENANVTFTPGTESGTIELSYGNGIDINADGTFEAYFVSLPGTITITELAVATDKYNYVKTIEGGKEFTFTNTSLKPIKFDLTTATKEEAAPSVNVYCKVTSTTDLEVGAQYLLVFEGLAGDSDDGDPKVFKPILSSDGTTFSKTTSNALDVEIENGTISSNEFEGSHLTLETGYYLKADAVGSYLYPTGSSSGGGTLSAESTPANALTIGFDDGIVQIKTNSGSNYLVWSTSSHYFSSNAQVSGSYSTGICLYKLDDGRQPQSLSFTPEANAEYDLGSSTWTVAVPTLNGAQTSVTYALSDDSNPAVATVDADGTVHPIARGTVTIVATAAANAQYRAASASYTLRVIDSTVAINTYYKVTSTSDLEAGAQYLMVYEGGSKVFKPILESSSSTTFTKSTDNALNAEISGGMITSNDFENCHLTLESGYYLKADAAGKYLYPDVASSRGVLSAESSASHSLNITIGSNGIASIITKSGTYYLVWSTSSDYFSANTDIEGSYSTGICLYKLDDGRQPQTLSFSPAANAEYDLGTSTWTVAVPTLNGVQTSVSYALSDDSNPEVATVDADGTVHPKSRGTVTIIATAAANAQYRAGSASYTLTITDSSVSIPTWYKADEIEDGETYLVISNGSALKNNSGSLAAETNSSFTGDSFQYEAESDLLWLVTGNSSSFTLKNDGKYLRRSSSGGSLQISSTNSSNTCTYDGSYVKIATSYVLYCNDGSWTTGNSTNDSRKVSFYTSTPPRQSQTLAFSATSVNFDIAGSATFTAPTLSGAKTTVTYSSSKPTVATVDAITGAVEIVGTGTTIITASAEETDTYKPATATYTIHVTDSSAPVTTKRYVLASSIENGKNYIIVSGGYALKNDGGSPASVAVSPVDGAIEFDSEVDEDIIWEANYDTTIPEVGDYTFTNGTYRVNRKSSSGSFSLTFVSTTSGVDKYQLWLLKEYNGNTYFYHNSNNSQAAGYTYYIYYNSGWKITASSNSNPTSTEQPTQLYVEDGN
jgi:hypothetical protein